MEKLNFKEDRKKELELKRLMATIKNESAAYNNTFIGLSYYQIYLH